MKKITVIICALFICASTFGASTNFMVNLATAKHKAAVEGKLYIVQFTANWCTPCKWMDSHTFTDERVVNYLKENYVPVKINVEDFDGIIIKQKNNVQYLPTLLIFNSKGEEVGRFEEAVGPSKLMAILEENNIPNNKVKTEIAEPIEAENPASISRPLLPSIFDDSDQNEVIAEVSVIENGTAVPNLDLPAPSTTLPATNAPSNNQQSNNTEVTNIPVYTPPTNEPMISTAPEIKPNNQVVVANENNNVTVIENNSYTTAVVESPAMETNNAAAESLAFLTGEGIFELDVKFKNKQGYSVQIGLYAQYENVLAEVNKFNRQYDQRIFVHIGKRNGVPVYRLLMGSYTDKRNADQLEALLKSQGLDCFVNDLSKI